METAAQHQRAVTAICSVLITVKPGTHTADELKKELLASDARHPWRCFEPDGNPGQSLVIAGVTRKRPTAKGVPYLVKFGPSCGMRNHQTSVYRSHVQTLIECVGLKLQGVVSCSISVTFNDPPIVFQHAAEATDAPKQPAAA